MTDTMGREMKYWYVEVPITEGKFCKRFDSQEEAEKEKNDDQARAIHRK